MLSVLGIDSSQPCIQTIQHYGPTKQSRDLNRSRKKPPFLNLEHNAASNPRGNPYHQIPHTLHSLLMKGRV